MKLPCVTVIVEQHFERIHGLIFLSWELLRIPGKILPFLQLWRKHSVNLSHGPVDEHTSLNFFSGGIILAIYVIIDLPYTQGLSSHFS